MMPVIACPDCAEVQQLPEIESGRLVCVRCHSTLERATGRSLDAALACALATLVLLVPMDCMRLLHVSKAGMHASSDMLSGVSVLWSKGWVLTAGVVLLQAVLLPYLRFGLLVLVLGATRLGHHGAWRGRAFRWAESLDLWAMPDVFVIGFAIGYSRLAPFVPVTIGGGGWCLIGAALTTMLTRATIDRRSIWRRIQAPYGCAGDTIGCLGCDLVLPAHTAGQRCPRCRMRVFRRRPYSMLRPIALVVAGYALYPVANYYPVSIFTLAGQAHERTLFSSVMQLVDANLLPLAVLIFVTSIGIPLGKLVGMTWLFLSVRQRSARHLVAKTRVFRLIDELGRWSNADIFTLAVFMPLVQFGALAQVNLGQGMPALQAVVVLTMLASALFDPRRLWDAAGRTT